MIRLRFLAALLAGLLALAAGPASAADSAPAQAAPPPLEPVQPTELRTWAEGPVRYLLSGPEERFFRQLTTDRERRAFIKQFWLRRDPNIRSFENEFRFDFWRRVLEANQLFTRTTVPGWKTDRGRFFILLGPPDFIERTTMPGQRRGVALTLPDAQGEGMTSQEFGRPLPSEGFYGLERWTYQARLTARLPPNFVLAFALRDSGEYELSTDPRDWSLYGDMLSEVMGAIVEPETTAFSDAAADNEVLQLYNDVATALDFGTLQRVPEPEDLLADLVTSEEFFGAIPILVQVDYYKTAGPATLAVFTIGIEPRLLGALAPEGGLLAAGRLESLEQPGRSELLAGDQALVPCPENGAGGLLLFQGLKALPPGSYNATFGILDRSSNRIGSHRERIRVPEFPERGLVLSTLALARTLAPLASAAGPLEGEPYRMGNYRVVPKGVAEYTRGEEFGLYYQVYGASADPLTGAARLDVTYRFFVLGADGFQPIGKPIRMPGRTEPVQGWTFPLANWPVATFRLEVTVEDVVSGEVAVGQTVFSVKDATGAPTAASSGPTSSPGSSL